MTMPSRTALVRQAAEIAAVALALAAFVVLLVLAAAPLGAQASARTRLVLVPFADSVRLVLADPPPPTGGFVVYRRVAGARDGAYRLLTAAPVERVRDPAEAAAVIGADMPFVVQAMRAEEPVDAVVRLRADRFASDVMSQLHPSVARALGRLYVDGGLTRGTAYEYRVVFTDARGAETPRAATGRVVAVDVPPPAPTALTGSAGSEGATLSWRYPRYRGDAGDITIGFHVYRAEGDGSAPRRITEQPVLRNDAAPLEYVDRGARIGTRYRYTVRAVDLAQRESAPTAPVVIVPVDRRAPVPPTNVATEPEDGRVHVVWQPSPDADVAGYQVERASGLDQPYARVTHGLVRGRTDFTDTTVTGGSPYFYRVLAVDAAGNASVPSTAIAALPVDHTPPAPPSAVAVAVAGHRLRVRWTASPSRDVRGYYVYRGGGRDRLVRLVGQPVTGTEFVDSGYAGAGLVPGGHYALRVSAVDRSYNESAPVQADATIPDDDPPAAPTGFHARNAAGRWVALDWSASPALDVRRYALTRAESGSAPVEVGQYAADAAAGARDTAALHGHRYVYRLEAVDSAGNRGPAAEDTLDFRDLVAPPAPRATAARLTPRGIEVSWERVVEGELAGYNVYRAALPTGAFVRVTSSPVTAQRFVDPGGRPELYYVVRAVDRSANESKPSPAARAAGQR